jgi:serine protease Do
MRGQATAASSGYSALVARISPSVVTVLVDENPEAAGQRAAERLNADNNEDHMRELVRRLLSGPGGTGPTAGEVGSALGSGFVISADGLIVTNRHVIVGARKLWVKLTGGKRIPAELVGADAPTDIALLRVHTAALPALRLESSVKVAVGDQAIAIGNPFGLGQSVTAGIISARGRTLDADPYIDFLQTDAAINLGNSGGPLLSTDGAVIGVTSAIISPSGGSVGIAFAIPAETVAFVVAQLQKHGHVERGYLGVSAQEITPVLATAIPGLGASSGALIVTVDASGPAAGTLLNGDVLMSIGTSPVTFATLGKIAVRLKPGDLATLNILRSGRRQAVALRVGQFPDPPGGTLQTGGSDTWVPNLELGVAQTSSEIRKAINADEETSGLIVTQLRREGPGGLAGLKVGDLITDVGSKHVESVADIATIAAPSIETPALLRVMRNGSAGFVAITGHKVD